MPQICCFDLKAIIDDRSDQARRLPQAEKFVAEIPVYKNYACAMRNGDYSRANISASQSIS
jgi:hypothetical protein